MKKKYEYVVTSCHINVLILTSKYLQTLAKVICTVLRFSAEQTQRVMEKEHKKAVRDLSFQMLVQNGQSFEVRVDNKLMSSTMCPAVSQQSLSIQNIISQSCCCSYLFKYLVDRDMQNKFFLFRFGFDSVFEQNSYSVRNEFQVRVFFYKKLCCRKEAV